MLNMGGRGELVELLYRPPIYCMAFFTWGISKMRKTVACMSLIVTGVFGLVATPALAETPEQVLASLKEEASKTAGFQGFSVARGESFYREKHGGEWSCSSCHTDNPANQGKHAKSDKLIQPLAPSANPERFTDIKKIEKWFKRNCNDVLDRTCTAQEKGDVLFYLLSARK